MKFDGFRRSHIHLSADVRSQIGYTVDDNEMGFILQGSVFCSQEVKYLCEVRLYANECEIIVFVHCNSCALVMQEHSCQEAKVSVEGDCEAVVTARA